MKKAVPLTCALPGCSLLGRDPRAVLDAETTVGRWTALRPMTSPRTLRCSSLSCASRSVRSRGVGIRGLAGRFSYASAVSGPYTTVLRSWLRLSLIETRPSNRMLTRAPFLRGLCMICTYSALGSGGARVCGGAFLQDAPPPAHSGREAVRCGEVRAWQGPVVRTPMATSAGHPCGTMLQAHCDHGETLKSRRRTGSVNIAR